MAQKAAKATAKRNTEVLNRTHMIALIVNVLFLLLRAFIFNRSFTRGSFLRWAILSAPAFAIEFTLERNSRPKYIGEGAGAELRSSGEDIDAKGLTEWMWDVLYWTWGCTAAAALLGDWVWWGWVAIPLYSAYLAYTTFGSVRKGLGGMGQPQEGTSGQPGSKRQQKLEKRGAQRMPTR